MTSTSALARATINLPGFKAGETRYVDLESDYVRECLEARWLILIHPAGIPTDERSTLKP